MIGHINEHPPLKPSVFVPFLRLEKPYPEEKEILKIEVEINKVPNSGMPIDGLIKERQEKINSWKDRVNKDLDDVRNKSRKKDLENELDTVKAYDSLIMPHDRP